MKVKIYPINNNCQNSFNAKFTKKDIKELIQVCDTDNKSVYPKIYTMLKYLTEAPFEKVQFEYVVDKKGDKKYRIVKRKNDLYKYIEENKSIGVQIVSFVEKYGRKSKEILGVDYQKAVPMNALKDATVTAEDEHYGYIKMPERIFEQEWWNNRHVTVDDIKKLAIDA